jgi:hypothetical protein
LTHWLSIDLGSLIILAAAFNSTGATAMILLQPAALKETGSHLPASSIVGFLLVINRENQIMECLRLRSPEHPSDSWFTICHKKFSIWLLVSDATAVVAQKAIALNDATCAQPQGTRLTAAHAPFSFVVRIGCPQSLAAQRRDNLAMHPSLSRKSWLHIDPPGGGRTLAHPPH